MTLDPIWPKWHPKRLTFTKKVNIGAMKLYLEFALMNLDSDETSRDIRTGVLHRTSIPFIWTEWFGLASHFEKNAWFELTSKIPMFIFLGTRSQNGFYPKCSNQKGSCKHKHIHMHRTLKYWKTNHFKSPKHIHMHIHIHIHMHMHIHIQIHIPCMGPAGPAVRPPAPDPAGPM